MENKAFGGEEINEQRNTNSDIIRSESDNVSRFIYFNKTSTPNNHINLSPNGVAQNYAETAHQQQRQQKQQQQQANDAANESDSDEKDWKDYTQREKISFSLLSVIKFAVFILLLYLFLLSLSFMSIGFNMISVYAIQAGDVIKFVLSNPFAALTIGIVVTAIMQNATATTSIAVIMVGAGIIPSVKSAVPIIMGANIGTCVTNSFIALTLAGDPNEFKRAFSAATLNDGFNLLTTLIMLPIEIVTGFLYVVSDKITNAIPFDNTEQIAKANFMAAILNPVTDVFILLNATAVDILSSDNKDISGVALTCCKTQVLTVLRNFTTNSTNNTGGHSNTTTLSPELSSNHKTLSWRFLYKIDNLFWAQNNNNNNNSSSNNDDFNNASVLRNSSLLQSFYVNETICLEECKYWCMPMLKGIGEGGTGLFWVIFSIVVLIGSLFGIVKILSLFIIGPIAVGVRRAINKSFPSPFKWVSQLILFLIAFLLTIIVQSSNIITATLVPLCGIGIISLQRVYVMTLGSNIGTTVTGILTAFTQPPSSLKKAMQLAFVYTMFNSIGVLFWLPVPLLRVPKRYARKLGTVVFQYRWFLYLYVFSVYFVVPLLVFGIALIPYWIGLAVVGIPLVVAALAFASVAVLQAKLPHVLPHSLRTFDKLPLWMRSIKFYDDKMQAIRCCGDRKATKTKAATISDTAATAAAAAASGAGAAKYGDDGDDDIETSSRIIDSEPIDFSHFIRKMSTIDSLIKESRRSLSKNSTGKRSLNKRSHNVDKESDENSNSSSDEKSRADDHNTTINNDRESILL